MRQPLNTNPRLDEQVRRALNKIKRPSKAEETTELLNQELSPGDNPFSEATNRTVGVQVAGET
jgi:hypothetical protein